MITGRSDCGGGPEHVFQLCRQLLGDCEVFIAAPREAPYWDRFAGLVGESRVCEIPHRHFSWPSLRRLIAWSRKHSIEIVHSHGRAAGLYGRLGAIGLRCPSIHTQHGPLQFRSWRVPIFWMGDLVLSWSTAHLIAVSASEASSIRRQLLRSRGISTIPNGVLLPGGRVDSRVLSRRPLPIVHVSRFVPQKNSEMVLDILDQLRSKGALDDFHVDMVGDGPGRGALEREARTRALDGHITFHGAQPSVGGLLLGAFCLLTTSRWEGLPLAVLEALALGLPVVASDTPGNNDVVSPSVGRLFPLGDAAAAAGHLVALRDSSDGWQALSSAASSLVREKYSARRMAEDTLAIYRQTAAVSHPVAVKLAKAKQFLLVCVAGALCASGLASPAPLDLAPACGVNVHASLLYPGDLARIRGAGFTWVRVDLRWENVERRRGTYDFGSFDVLASGLRSQGLRAVVILAYGNPLYAGRGAAPPFLDRVDSDEFREGYAAFSLAAVAHYAGRGYIWEQWNEPNNKHSWPRAPNGDAYVALMRKAGAAIRQSFPAEILVGPASSYVDLPFIEACLRGGMLEFWNGVSVHPYRQTAPEAAARDFARLRDLLSRYGAPGERVPVICSEWGYSTAWKGYDDQKQADFLRRMFHFNRAEGIPLTIWYDWRDDGDDPANPEDRFGLVRRGPGGLFEPKPAYFAARRELAQSSP
jgi:glycosyltransferase involved in cell wall biosynthesis